jgi:rhodanese-related sulfurtransferase
MRTTHRLSGALAAMLSLGAAAAACSKPDPAAHAQTKIAALSVEAVDKALAAGEVVPIDANSERTRKKMGVVPGAVLLSDSELFSISELPGDKSKSLVFYCANTSCSASHEAAGRALSAGYSSVKVMDEGIAGWVAAGKRVQTL